MISNLLRKTSGMIWILFILFSLNLSAQNHQQSSYSMRNGSCDNLDFSLGTTTGWQARWCNSPQLSNYDLPASNLLVNGFNSSTSFNQPNFVHEIMKAGTDKFAPIPTVAPGHTYSLRLGSDSAIKASLMSSPATFPYHHQMVKNTFHVTPQNCALTVWTAMVFTQNSIMPHPESDQPYIKMKVFDVNNNLITCLSTSINPVIGLTKKNFKRKPIANSDEETVYSDWAPLYISIAQYIGQQVTIQFESSDCRQGGHAGYLYLSVDCSTYQDQEIKVGSLNCQNDTLVLTAPAGLAAYFWTGPGIIPPATTQTVKINAPGQYNVKLSQTGDNGVSCDYTWNKTISTIGVKSTALFSNTSTCKGQPVYFTDTSTLNDIPTNWSWDFNNDGVEDSNVQNPVYSFNTAGIHPVKLKITQGNCVDETTKDVDIAPGYVLIITDQTDTITGSVDLTKPQVTLGSTTGAVLSYWIDSKATNPLLNPTAVTTSGTYYIKIGSDSCAIIKPVVVKVGLITSIAESLSKTELFNVFPNPAFQTITIEAKKGMQFNFLMIEVTNIVGEQLYFYKNENSGPGFERQLDLSAFPKGLFFLHIKTNKNDYIEKIILQ